MVYCDEHVEPSALVSQMAHVSEHTPFEQVPPSHEFPHEPQAVADVSRSWQPSVQSVSPEPQNEEAVQTPLAQVWALVQVTPHSPQFVVEVRRFTHRPLQLVRGEVHDVVDVQAPSLQKLPEAVAQALPQAPQSVSESRRYWHPSLHWV